MWLPSCLTTDPSHLSTRPPACSANGSATVAWPWASAQEAAAVRCGIHWTQLGKVERGQRSLRLETIVKIADGLEIDAGDLVSELPLPPGEPA
ncbi:helix-turn-helix domain-containing protein [Mycobacterium sp. E2497]|uniref:helix-turn-helix domain-containing protein n=1 Tax=Mycobacterium sp. E2497 TaxID=1834135 RepID=UPI00350FF534